MNLFGDSTQYLRGGWVIVDRVYVYCSSIVIKQQKSVTNVKSGWGHKM